MGTNTLLDEIPTYSVVDFLHTKDALTIKGEEIRKSISNASAILEISGKLSLSLNLTMIVRPLWFRQYFSQVVQIPSSPSPLE